MAIAFLCTLQGLCHFPTVLCQPLLKHSVKKLLVFFGLLLYKEDYQVPVASHFAAITSVLSFYSGLQNLFGVGGGGSVGIELGASCISVLCH